ncbi:hypothetical protein F4560_003122 [Saccharothrix ecbatanensis]|uniref:Uncharacterized protein n=1 Tax=Saccharothrix ecbatanensis TaxID=1105145 RepID=A0A7W9M0W4_9PSEU|nr:hypothetical protein [Saccharothrix ecbatanensis]MBB5803354.1 hypothetical protein [Saccharothrix ecbatanensis]
MQLWLPEAGGVVRFGSPLHEALLTVLAARSQAEVVRSRHRVTIAMRMQTVEQGRYLGGRPPYGYRLVDAGAHPNRALAKLHPAAEVDQALGTAAIAGRFAENDLIRILAHQAGRDQAEPTRAGEAHSLQPRHLGLVQLRHHHGRE